MGPDVIAIGEILIDFVAIKPVPYGEAPAFEKCFGGAPMNTIVAVSRLGVSAGAITAVGDDPFGQFLIEELKRNRVDVSQVKVKGDRRTTITFVANEPETGERSFLFYRRPWTGETADSALEPKDIDPNYIGCNKTGGHNGHALRRRANRILEACCHVKVFVPPPP